MIKSPSELTEQDKQLIASPRFDAVAGLFADAKRYGTLVNDGYGEASIPVVHTSGEVDYKTRIIPLQSPKVTLGEFVLTRGTISKIVRGQRGLGKIAVPADELEILRALDVTGVQIMRDTIHSLAEKNARIFERS